MACTKAWKRKISCLLVLALLISPAQRVSAEEETGETEQPQVLTEPAETVSTQATEAAEETEYTEATEAGEETENTEATEAGEETENTEATEAGEETENTEATEAGEETENTESTEVTEETECTEETEVTEATEEAVPLMLLSMPVCTSIADVLAMAAGEDVLVIEGTVVFFMGLQAVLQDDTGGIRMSFTSAPDIAVGDILQVTGCRSGGFSVAEYEKTGSGSLPVVESTLEAGQNDVRILVKGVTLGYGTLSQNGYICQLKANVPEGIAVGACVDACGVMLDGTFYADTITAAQTPKPESSMDSEWNFYFGQLHAHTDISDGTGSVAEAFAYARQVENLDFFAVTDHSNSFDNALSGALETDGSTVSSEWAAGKEAAKAVTDENFVGIFAYEMTWPEDLAIGHINTFGTAGWLTRDQAGMNTLEGYLEALSAAPASVSQFNHPGTVYGDFRNFSEHTPQYDARVHLLEVGGEGSFTAYDAYTTALDKGWHLAPSNNQTNHNGSWGSVSQARTVVLAKELTEAAIYDAIRNYRVYATVDADLKIEFRLNGAIMGSILPEEETLTAEISLEDGSGDAIGRVEVITEGGTVAASVTVSEAAGECSVELPDGSGYYYLRLLRNDVITAVTAPVWVDPYEDLGISGFTADTITPDQGAEVQLTLTLFNHEDLPFVVQSVTFTAGNQVIGTVTAPGSVAAVGELQIPLTYTQETAGAVGITATVTGTIGGISRSYQETLTLRYQAPEAELMSVGDVRSGSLGTAFRIRGYVTAGTANAYNTFPGSIYLQDDTGGIEVTDFTQEGIQVGAPMEIQGVLRSKGGNLVLAMTDYEILETDYYRYVPSTMAHGTAMDYAVYGGQLLQIEGSVVSMTATADKLGISRFTIRDVAGDLATVVIEDSIRSGAYGTNELASEVKATRTIRVIGLLHVDDYGQTVLRVRNCDEVAYVPPVADPTNPKTGDRRLLK